MSASNQWLSNKSHRLFTALATLCAPAFVSAAIPATAGWYEVPNTTLQAVCPPRNFGGVTYEFDYFCQNVTAAWSGGTLDTTRNRLYLWGGGHHDYYGNELYALDLTNLVMQRLTDPAVPLASDVAPPPGELSPNNGTQPNARHTYDGLEYMPNVDRMWAFSGSLAGAGYADSRTWIYDPNTNTWRRVTPAGDPPEAAYGVVSAYDPVTKKIFFHNRSGLYTYEYDANGGRYTRLNSDGYLDIHMNGVIDPVRRLFIIVGSGKQYVYDIGSGSTYTRQTLGATGALAVINPEAPGLAYDSAQDRIIAWSGGGLVYTLDVANRVWSSTEYTGGPAVVSSANGTYGRWQYVPSLGVFVVYNDYNINAFTLRITAGGGTTPAPVVTLTAARTTIAPGESASLTWSASNATSCYASGAWIGQKAVSGTETAGPLNATGTFGLSCSGAGGTGEQSVNVAVAAPDIVAPMVPGNVSATVRSTTQIDLAWTASTDAVGVAGYRVYRDGTRIASVTASTYSDTNLAPATSYGYTVTAYDAAGNESPQSAAVSAQTQTGGTLPDADADWLRRSTAPGVVRAFNFDTEAEVTTYRYPDTAGRYVYTTWDTQQKASGNGSLRFEIPSNSPADTSGSWRINFADDLQTQFGENEEFYIQWRQRFAPYFLEHKYRLTTGSGGWKQIIIGQGDGVASQPGYDQVRGWPEVNSCTETHLVMQNVGFHGYPAMYHSCWVYEMFDDYVSAVSNYTRQNQVPDCYYYNRNGQSNASCLRYVANEWMTFQIHVKLGPWSASAVDANTGNTRAGFTNSTVEFWGARDGQPSVLLHRETGLVLRRGNLAEDWRNSAHDARYGKLWLLPYITGKDSTEVTENTFTWYDEVIVSRSRIADPGVASPPPPVAPTVTLAASASSVPANGSVSLTWQSNGADSCTATGGWTGTKVLSGSESVSPAADTTYILTCRNTAGVSTARQVSVTVVPIAAPTVALSAGASSVQPAGAVDLTWSSTNADTCTASADWSGGKATSGTETVTPTRDSTYVLTCSNAGGSAVQEVRIRVIPAVAPPTVNLMSSASSVTLNDSVSLVWSSSGADSCEATGQWSGVKPTSGTETVAPTANSTYALTCINAGGSTAQQVTIAVVAGGEPNPVPGPNPPPAPTVSLAAGQSSTDPDAVTLTWSSAGADACTATGDWSGTKPLSGIETVTPTTDSIYALTCSNAGGSTAQQVKIAASDRYVTITMPAQASPVSGAFGPVGLAVLAGIAAMFRRRRPRSLRGVSPAIFDGTANRPYYSAI